MAKKTIWHQSVGKFEIPPLVNEDAAKSDITNRMIAVSDGAGGGGVFADLWSRYLVNYLPTTPISTFEELDKWIDKIWEPFYNYCERLAQREGGLLLDKFYDEGSFATLVAVWQTSETRCRWISYGDSVAFMYNPNTKVLSHSFSKLADFNKPPYLLNCKDESNPQGFKTGEFEVEKGSIVFCASDALSHYIIASYELGDKEKYSKELEDATSAHSKNSVCIEAIENVMQKNCFYKNIIQKLVLNASRNKYNFSRHLRSLESKRMLSHDDYSIAVMRIENNDSK